MSRKRRIFDVDMADLSDVPAQKTSERVGDGAARRGPMASAISENADSLRERRGLEQAIRAENDQLAHELVRLKKQGLIVDLVALEDVVAEKLIRDRADGPDVELQELKDSIKAIGLSNPIRIEARPDGKYELVQGMRRLSAFRELFAETGKAKYAKIPAGIDAAGETTESMYRRMVDENLIRKGISFAEMAQLARSYADDPATDCADADKAVAVLFGSAGYQKRSYIRAFVGLLGVLGDRLEHPQKMPRSLGLELKKILSDDPSQLAKLRFQLAGAEGRNAADELAILRHFTGSIKPDAKTFPAGKPRDGVVSKARQAKTTFQVARREGIAKCAASSGRLELKLDKDFSTIDRRKLERAVAVFLDALD